MSTYLGFTFCRNEHLNTFMHRQRFLYVFLFYFDVDSLEYTYLEENEIVIVTQSYSK